MEVAGRERDAAPLGLGAPCAACGEVALIESRRGLPIHLEPRSVPRAARDDVDDAADRVRSVDRRAAALQDLDRSTEDSESLYVREVLGASAAVGTRPGR